MKGFIKDYRLKDIEELKKTYPCLSKYDKVEWEDFNTGYEKDFFVNEEDFENEEEFGNGFVEDQKVYHVEDYNYENNKVNDSEVNDSELKLLKGPKELKLLPAPRMIDFA